MIPLYYLKDNDIIQLLEDYVLKAYVHKKKQSLENARKYHENNFQECIDINKRNHYLISDVITDLKENHSFKYPVTCVNWLPIIEFRGKKLGWYKNIYQDFSWTPLCVSEKIKLYNDTVKGNTWNTKLQRYTRGRAATGEIFYHLRPGRTIS